MIKTIFLSGLFLLSSPGMSQTEAEEAIILNQELQFLEDSVSSIQPAAVRPQSTEQASVKAINDPGLERTYFGNELEEDSVQTRSSANKKRGF